MYRPLGMLQIVGGLFCSAIALVGLVLFGGGLRALLRAAGSRRWPTVPGKVVESGVATRVAPAVIPDERELPSREQTVHRPVIRYEYTVKSIVFSSNDIGFGATESSSSGQAGNLAARFPVGREVTVHYDPDDPSEACLQPGIQSTTFIPLVVGLGMSGLGAAMWMVFQTFLRR